MATTIKNFVRAIRWYDGVVAAVLFVAWISIGPRAEVPQGYPLHYTTRSFTLTGCRSCWSWRVWCT